MTVRARKTPLFCLAETRPQIFPASRAAEPPLYGDTLDARKTSEANGLQDNQGSLNNLPRSQ